MFERAADAMRIDPAAAKAGESRRQSELRQIARRRAAAKADAETRVRDWLDRLADFRVLDPACGSGNFLYVALHELLDLEQRAILDAERLGLSGFAARVGLQCVRGIEIERYAAELARLTLWIGYLQWVRRRGGRPIGEPILSTLDQIENRDAVLNPDGTEAEWPAVDVIIGNPPFLGGKRMRDNLGDAYVERLFAAYKGRVPAEADFVSYWVEKAWRAIESGHAARAGLVTTNSIRGGANRRVLDPIADANAIWEAWADQPWVLEGAAVRVSMLGFGAGFVGRRLEGSAATAVNSDLTGGSLDLTKAVRLTENANVAFMGDTKGGAFDISGEQARDWLVSAQSQWPANSDVLRPWRNAMDVTRRSADKWIIDFGWTMRRTDAALYEAPFGTCSCIVKPVRELTRAVLTGSVGGSRREPSRHVSAVTGLHRYIVTPEVSKYRVFVWFQPQSCLTSNLHVIARDDDVTFGILHSQFTSFGLLDRMARPGRSTRTRRPTTASRPSPSPGPDAEHPAAD